MRSASALPLSVLNGSPGYINFLDALYSWQLVFEAANATQRVVAASFKHTHPNGFADGRPLTLAEKLAWRVDDVGHSSAAAAYIRARGCDRVSAYGDFIAISDAVDESAARFIAAEVSDGIVAPDYSSSALEILRSKKSGKFVVFKADPAFEPALRETRTVFGVDLEQDRNTLTFNERVCKNVVTHNDEWPDPQALDAILGCAVLKFSQSNSVCIMADGRMVGVASGHTSRVHAIRAACDKMLSWTAQFDEKILDWLQSPPRLKRFEVDTLAEQFSRWSALSELQRQDICRAVANRPIPTVPDLPTKDRLKALDLHPVLCRMDTFHSRIVSIRLRTPAWNMSCSPEDPFEIRISYLLQTGANSRWRLQEREFSSTEQHVF